MKHASLCTGIGACELAATWMGWENIFSCEIDKFCNKALKHHYPNTIKYGNIFETKFSRWKGRIDVLTAGFPCQPFSVAGKQLGAADDRYLWPEVLRVIREVEPRWFIGENVAGIGTMVFPGEEINVESYTDILEESHVSTKMCQQFIIDRICQDLESVGYTIQPIIIPACAVGAPHQRDRIWFIANRADAGVETLQQERENRIFPNRTTPDPDSDRCRNRKSEQEFVHECKRTSNDSESREDGITPDSTSKGFQDRIGLERWANEKKIGPGMDCKPERHGENRFTPDTDGKRLPSICFTGCPKEEEREIENRCPMQYTSDDREAHISDWWQNFPTQSPVCDGNDGVSGRLSGISFPKWRINSIKALGNSMVPQVVYEIFKAIELVDKTFTKKTI